MAIFYTLSSATILLGLIVYLVLSVILNRRLYKTYLPTNTPAEKI